MHSFFTCSIDAGLSLDLDFDGLTPKGKKIVRIGNVFWTREKFQIFISMGIRSQFYFRERMKG